MGPNSRALLQKLTSADLSNAAFPFGTSREIEIGYAHLRASRISYMKVDGGPMRFFNDMRIRDKIFVGYLLAILAVIGVAGVSWRYLAATDQRFEQAVGRDVPQIRVLEHLRNKAAALIHTVDVFASRAAVNQLRADTTASLATERAAMRGRGRPGEARVCGARSTSRTLASDRG